MKTLLLVGSSIFEQWTNAADLCPSDQVINRAIGGTTTRDWLDLLPTTLAQTGPDAVCLYCGSNDLNREYTASEIIANLARLQQIIDHQTNRPRYAYFSIIQAPQKAGKWALIDQINAAVRQQLPADALYVELNTLFVEQGNPVAAYFIEDGLHLTYAAYAAMVAYSAPRLQVWLASG